MSKYLGKKWGVREWTPEMKTKWQEKMFEEGFSWCGHHKVAHLAASYYWTIMSTDLGHIDDNDVDFFFISSEEQMHYEDVFPKEETSSKLDVIQEIVDLVDQRKQEVPAEVPDEDERSFEG